MSSWSRPPPAARRRGWLPAREPLGWDVPILGISIDETQADLQAKVADLATRTAAHLGRADVFTPDEILVNDSYLGAGYGIVGDLEREAVGLMAQTEGILLDPVYTGRAFGGLMDLLRTHPDTFAGPDRSGPSQHALLAHRRPAGAVRLCGRPDLSYETWPPLLSFH